MSLRRKIQFAALAVLLVSIAVLGYIWLTFKGTMPAPAFMWTPSGNPERPLTITFLGWVLLSAGLVGAYLGFYAFATSDDLPSR